MIKDFFVCSKIYLLILMLLLLFFYVIFNFYGDYILSIDERVADFVSNMVVRDEFTSFFKVITNFGDVFFFATCLLVIIIFSRDKVLFLSMVSNLGMTFVVNVIFKNIIRRVRPIKMLISKPHDFSFPSGHTMCSLAFFGFVIYVISKRVKNRYLRYFINILMIVLAFMVACSRVYLGVHFFTDVMCGVIVGIICLLMFINYVKIKDII